MQTKSHDSQIFWDKIVPPPFSLQSSYFFYNIIEQSILFQSLLLYQIFIFQKIPLKLLEKYEFILEMLFKGGVSKFFATKKFERKYSKFHWIFAHPISTFSVWNWLKLF